jgi:hypothetical protein
MQADIISENIAFFPVVLVSELRQGDTVRSTKMITKGRPSFVKFFGPISIMYQNVMGK